MEYDKQSKRRLGKPSECVQRWAEAAREKQMLARTIADLGSRES